MPVQRSKIVRALLATMAFLLAGRLAVADSPPTPDSVQRVYRAVDSNASIVMAFVYPSATFNQLQGCQWDSKGYGYMMTCRFAYTDILNNHLIRDIEFDVNSLGIISAVGDSGGPSNIAPFGTMNFLIQRSIEYIRQDMAKHPDNYNDFIKSLMSYLPDDPTPQQLLTLFLNLRTLGII